MRPVESIEITFDMYDFWLGFGWTEDNYISHIETKQSERNYCEVVAQRVAANWDCKVHWWLVTNGSGDDILVVCADEDDAETERAVGESVRNTIGEVYQDYKAWIMEAK